MATDVLMPRLSLEMKEGTVGKWYKKEGDTVEKGEPLVEVVSEKATYDLEAPATGVLRRIVIEAGEDVPVNTVLAVIASSDELVPDITHKGVVSTDEEQEKKVFASPAAKRLAKEHGVDLSRLRGTGPEGRIDEQDVRTLIEKQSEDTRQVKEIIPLTSYRKTSAERLTTSFRTAPHSTVIMEVDVTEAAELREQLKVSYTAMIVKAVAGSLKEVPLINSTLQGDYVKVYENVNVGVAVSTERGLVVPVVHGADKKTLKEIDAKIVELTEKARDAKLSKEDLEGGTFTITNLGMFGVDFFIPIINPPEAAILAVGRMAQKVVPIDSKIEIRSVMMLSLAYDHRIVDGAPAAQFLRSVKDKIEKLSVLKR
jgi:pyruvate dehydrogenase E2 component (dihydrolipoamide acetyltransferase)